MPFCPKCRDEFQDWVKKCPNCGVALTAKLPALFAKSKYSVELIVTIATFSYPTEAHLNRAKLESEGIDAFVADEHIIQANWLYSQAIGGIRLQVKESEAEKALSILECVSKSNYQEVSNSIESTNEHCPKCHLNTIQYRTFSHRPIFLLWLITALFVFNVNGGFTLPFLKRKWKCSSCGYEWKSWKQEVSQAA